MSEFVFDLIDGEQTAKTPQNRDPYHDVAIKLKDITATGTLVLTGRKPGSDIFEEIPDGTFDLANLNTIQFTGKVDEYKITITGSTGSGILYLTDASWGGQS